MTDGVYVVRDGVAYRATAARGLCNADRCDLFTAGVCDEVFNFTEPQTLPCDGMWQTMQGVVGPVGNVFFKRAEEVAQ